MTCSCNDNLYMYIPWRGGQVPPNAPELISTSMYPDLLATAHFAHTMHTVHMLLAWSLKQSLLWACCTYLTICTNTATINHKKNTRLTDSKWSTRMGLEFGLVGVHSLSFQSIIVIIHNSINEFTWQQILGLNNTATSLNNLHAWTKDVIRSSWFEILYTYHPN
jgi:hypothetical protein